MVTPDLSALGWAELWAPQLQNYGKERLVRITSRHKGFFPAISAVGHSLNCYLPGRLQFQAAASEFPTVGDWCVIDGEEFKDAGGNVAATILEVLPRRSKISRLASGHETAEQVLAANIDYCFIVTSANREFNLKRLQRYVLITRQGGVEPVVILSKIDIAEELAAVEQDLQRDFPGLAVIKTSIPLHTGLDGIRKYLPTGKTGMFIGSSGVGKSTLVNALLQQDMQQTREIRETDDRGRHTTSASSLLFIPGGGMIIDTAGLREIQVFGDSAGLEQTFENIQRFAGSCKFRDCTHATEPGCAVQTALACGELSRDEYDNHIKLQKELGYSNRQVDQRAAAQEKKRSKQITQGLRKKRKSEEKD